MTTTGPAPQRGKQPDATRGRVFTRRSVLLAGLGLAGVGVAASTPLGSLLLGLWPRRPATFASLVADEPFYIAHRGGGGNWPEMTAYAYARAAALPWVSAIEISVCLTADGVLVCSHDPSTLRVTGTSLAIGQVDWPTLSRLMVSATDTDDPGQPARPFSRFDEVIGRHLDDLVVFVEPKTPEAVEPLLARMVELGQPERTVWKQPINQLNFARAKQSGFATWGYILQEHLMLADRLPAWIADPSVDVIGIEKTQSDEVTRSVVDRALGCGKPTIMWAISTPAERERALALGCRGLMTPNIRMLPIIPC